MFKSCYVTPCGVATFYTQGYSIKYSQHPVAAAFGMPTSSACLSALEVLQCERFNQAYIKKGAAPADVERLPYILAF